MWSAQNVTKLSVVSAFTTAIWMENKEKSSFSIVTGS